MVKNRWAWLVRIFGEDDNWGNKTVGYRSIFCTGTILGRKKTGRKKTGLKNRGKFHC